jgi:hypothetical protein
VKSCTAYNQENHEEEIMTPVEEHAKGVEKRRLGKLISCTV